MAVEVCIWFPKGGNIGHAAMKVDGGSPPGPVYLSRWPGSLTAVFLIGDGTQNQFESDVSSEGGPPTIIRLTKLDETAIKSAVWLSNKASLYSTLALNCSTNVGLCLRQGIPDISAAGLTDTVLSNSGFMSGAYSAAKYAAISTPWYLYLYAQSLRPLYG